MATEQRARRTSLLDLPVDILLLIFPHLDASSFLALASTCSALHSPDILHDSAYWSSLVRRTFRVPNRPVVAQDGRRWHTLYKRLLTQSRVYTWGSNDKGCLGHSSSMALPLFQGRHLIQGRGRGRGRGGALSVPRPHPSSPVGWPLKMDGVEDLGIVADLQSGGWSTTLLTADGALWTVGVINGLAVRQDVQRSRKRLDFPPGYPQSNERYDPACAVSQFSAGRGHILAITDNGRIWSWHSADKPGMRIQFLHHDTMERGNASGRGLVKKVVAGWNKSAALMEGSGLILWHPLGLTPNDPEAGDGALVLQTAVVPETNQRSNSQRHTEDTEHTVGAVENFVVLEHLVLFTTDLGKAFASQIIWDNSSQTVTHPRELALSSFDISDSGEGAFATDIQGSFRSFAIFVRSGAVLTSNQDRLTAFLQHEGSNKPLFDQIPALQHKNVIQLAFGDYHFHALHSQGHITSYGYEPKRCGALGLGFCHPNGANLRGVHTTRLGGDGLLIPHAYVNEGRRVWFGREKRAWLEFLEAGGVDPETSGETRHAALRRGGEWLGAVSEWVEQEGRDWEEKFGVKEEGGGDDLGAHFALSVSAAGWHSGALVLESEGLVEKLSRAVEAKVPDEPEPSASDAQGNPPDRSDHQQIPEQTTPDATPSSSASHPTSRFESALTAGAEYARRLLGVETSDAPNDQVGSSTADTSSPNNGQNTSSSGLAAHDDDVPDYISPRKGQRYVWANDHFPRLDMGDERVMPGSTPVSPWRFGRPEFRDLARWTRENN